MAPSTDSDEEIGTVDDDTDQAPCGHQTSTFGYRDGKDQAPSLDPIQGGLGRHLAAYANGHEVVELDPLGNRCRSGRQVVIDGPAAGFFAQGDESGCGQHLDGPRAQGEGGVSLGHHEIDSGG